MGSSRIRGLANDFSVIVHLLGVFEAISISFESRALEKKI
jgi:hypothetical protein